MSRTKANYGNYIELIKVSLRKAITWNKTLKALNDEYVVLSLLDEQVIYNDNSC